MDWSKIPPLLAQALLPFQKEGVQFAVEKDGRCLIADEMGLGKTLQAISIASVYRDEWPLLVIVPSSLKFCWIEEFEKWLPDILPQEINLIRSGSDVSHISDSPISIVTYGLLRTPSAKLVKEAIQRFKFQIVICDESHYLKNSQTLSSKTIVPVIKTAKRRILLSGTPALARPVELFPQIDAVCPGRFGTFWQFTDRYCDPRIAYYGRMRQRKVDGASNLEELQKRLSSMLMIRREKSQVLKELPAKQRQRVLFELKDSNLKKDILQKFDALRQNIHKSSKTFQDLARHGSACQEPREDNRDQEDSMSVFRDISSLYRLSGEAKIGPVREYIEMLCENENLKFLVFAYHHAMMDGIEQSLYAKKIKFVRIDGHTKGFDRQTFVTQFQSDPTTRVAILSILAAGVGLTLTSAKLVVFAELYWTPGVMVQCEDRAHRIGQTDAISIHYLVAKNTMDEWVWSSVCRKTIVTTTALSGKCQQLEHGEGDQYQIEVLSKADVWKPPEETEDVDVAELVKSQRQPDQMSILDFFPSPSQQNNGKVHGKESNTLGRVVTSAVHDSDKREINKKSLIRPHLKRSRHLEFASPAVKIKAANKNLADCLIVLDSDEEEEFKPVRKRRKKRKHGVVGKKVTRVIKDVEAGNQDVEAGNQDVEPGNQDIEKDSDLKKEECEKILSDSDDLFSDKSSDSLPDVYLGPIKEKSHPDFCKIELKNNIETLDEAEKTNSIFETSIKQDMCNDVEKFENKTDTENKRKFSQKVVDKQEKSSSDIKTEPNSFELNINSMSEIVSEQSNVYVEPHSPSLTDNTLNVKSCKSKRKSEVSHREDIGCLDVDSSISVKPSNNENELKVDVAPVTPKFPRMERNISPDQSLSSKWPCPVCTYLNHEDLGSCELCDTPKRWSSLREKVDKETVATPNHSSNKTSCLLSSDNSESSLIDSTNEDNGRCTKDISKADSPSSCISNEICSFKTFTAKSNHKIQSFCRVVDEKDELEMNDVNCKSESAEDAGTESGKEMTLVCDSDVVKKTDGADCEIFPCDELDDEDLEMLENYSTLNDQLGDVDSITHSKLSDQHLLSSRSQSSSINTASSLLSKLSGCNEAGNGLLTSSSFTSSSSSSSLVTAASSTTENISLHNSASSSHPPMCHKTLKFSCSVNTGRIYVHDENECSLKVNFQPAEIEMGNTDGLPTFLKQPQHLRQLQRFVREWMGLSATKRRVIAKQGLVFERPMQAYEAVKSVHGCTQRHLIMDSLAKASEKAQSIQGHVRLIGHRKEGLAKKGNTLDEHTAGQGTAQVVTNEGIPLCLQCQKPYSNPLLPSSVVSRPENAWLLRLCSHACMDKYWTLKHASYCREQIYEIERGVCRICHFDAQGFYNKMKSIKDVRQRAEMVIQSPYRRLGPKARENLVTQILQGQFWHADHIVPVWKGGGMCDLDNLRTLCTPCHMKITKEQASQRAKVRKLSSAVSGGDITAFFKKS